MIKIDIIAALTLPQVAWDHWIDLPKITKKTIKKMNHHSSYSLLSFGET